MSITATHDTILETLNELIDLELAASQEEYEKKYHSMHEGESIIREEIEESKEALDVLEHQAFQKLHTSMRNEDLEEFTQNAFEIEKYARYLALEAIQVAATARKATLGLEEKLPF